MDEDVEDDDSEEDVDSEELVEDEDSEEDVEEDDSEVVVGTPIGPFSVVIDAADEVAAA